MNKLKFIGMILLSCHIINGSIPGSCNYHESTIIAGIPNPGSSVIAQTDSSMAQYVQTHQGNVIAAYEGAYAGRRLISFTYGYHFTSSMIYIEYEDMNPLNIDECECMDSIKRQHNGYVYDYTAYPDLCLNYGGAIPTYSIFSWLVCGLICGVLFAWGAFYAK